MVAVKHPELTLPARNFGLPNEKPKLSRGWWAILAAGIGLVVAGVVVITYGIPAVGVIALALGIGTAYAKIMEAVDNKSDWAWESRFVSAGQEYIIENVVPYLEEKYGVEIVQESADRITTGTEFTVYYGRKYIQARVVGLDTVWNHARGKGGKVELGIEQVIHHEKPKTEYIALQTAR